MPRKRRWKNKQKDIATPDWQHWKARRDLLEYLKRYRSNGVKFYESGKIVDKTPVIIGGVLLPEPDPTRPYLALPLHVTSKQRKVAHECCVEAHLYHHAIGDRESRQFIVSIYCNFLDFIPDDTISTSNTTKTVQQPKLYKFTPWICQPHHPWNQNGTKNNDDIYQQELQNWKKVHLKPAEKLYQYPSGCWRSDIDNLTPYDANESLANVPPPALNGDNWMLVDTNEKLQLMIDQLRSLQPSELAFDIEAYNSSRYTQVTCLIQIAIDTGHEYVIDPLVPEVWDNLHQLNEFFANPNIVKIGHSIGGLDVRCLHRDFGITVVNAFDTYHAAKVLELPQLGLAAICQYYGLQTFEEYRELKNVYQACNWQLRPLTPEMLLYGRYDVHYLVKMRKLMIRDLNKIEIVGKATRTESKEIKSFLAKAGNREDDDDNEESSSETVDNDETQKSSDDDDDSPDDIDDNMPNKVGSDELDNTIDTDDDMETVSSVSTLPPSLLQVLSQSQHDCIRGTWSGKSDSPWKNPFFQSLLRRGRRGETFWTGHHTDLYMRLVEWRKTVDDGMLHCLPGLIVSVEYLVAVACQQPTSMRALQRVYTDLPSVLQENPAIVKSMLKVVRDFLDENTDLNNRHKKMDKYMRYRRPILERLVSYKALFTKSTRNRVMPFMLGCSLAAGVVAIAVMRSRRERIK